MAQKSELSDVFDMPSNLVPDWEATAMTSGGSARLAFSGL